MPKIFYILFLTLTFCKCRKSILDQKDLCIGHWHFEVIYSSTIENEVKQVIVEYEGSISKNKTLESLILQHGNNDYLLIHVDHDGMVQNSDHDTIGVIDHSTCIIVDNDPKVGSIDHITITGTKSL